MVEHDWWLDIVVMHWSRSTKITQYRVLLVLADRLLADKPSRYATSHPDLLNILPSITGTDFVGSYGLELRIFWPCSGTHPATSSNNLHAKLWLCSFIAYFMHFCVFEKAIPTITSTRRVNKM